jgi:polysaccharide export outer membrane protein
MRQNTIVSSTKFLALFFIIVLTASCAANKEVIYFQDIQNIKKSTIENSASYEEPLIQADDNLSINIFTLNQQTGSIINQAMATPILGGNANTAVAQQVTGFVVDKNGDVELALAGKIKVAGLTTYQAREVIRERVVKYYNEPNVQVRFANFKVSVLGEVNAPSTYNMPNEKVSIMDALSLAGDLTIYGRRDNVLVVRDINGKKHYEHLDLNSSEIFNSEFFYLRQNDLVYVEPNKARSTANNAAQMQLIGIITSVLSVLILAVSALNN